MNVKFKSTLTGDIDDLDVMIQGKSANPQDYKVDYSGNLADAALTVVHQISGANNTDFFTIAYSCTGDGIAKSDPDNPTDVTGTIQHNDYIEVTLNIPLK